MQAKSGSIAEIVTKTKETAEKAAQQQAEIKKNAKAAKVNIKELAPSAGKWSVDPKIDMDTLTSRQTAAVSYLKAVSEVSGMNITLMSGVDVTGAFSVENGHYDGVTNTLYVSVNAGMQSITDITGSAILKTASHEITHYIAASGTQTYSLLEDYVLSRFTEQYGEKSVDNRIEDIQEQYKDQVGKELTREQAKEEMVAAACEMMLKNSEVFEKLARQNLTLAQRIKAGLDGFIKKLSANRKAAFENLDATSPEARAIAASEASLKETQKLWDNALKGAIKENEGGRAGKDTMLELRDEGRYNAEYEKPITSEDIEPLRSIGRKNIKDFTSEDIAKTQKWAYKFYRELGTKSPFFRASFGEWRAYDTHTVDVVSVPTIDIKDAVLKYGDYFIPDTSWEVYAGRTLKGDTMHYSGGERVNVKSLNAIEAILKNAVLLDTVTSENNTNKKAKFTAFLHKLYTPIRYNGQNYLAVTTIEEYFDGSNNSALRRAYNLKAIKIEPADGRLEINSTSPLSDAGSTISISNLYNLVKTNDKNFSAGAAANPILLNKDGTPKVFYHGTPFFGFNEFHDSANGIYLTDSLDVASTYSGSEGVRSVSNAEYHDIDSMNAKELAEFLNKYDYDFKEDTHYRYEATGNNKISLFRSTTEIDTYNLSDARSVAYERTRPSRGNYAVYVSADNILQVPTRFSRGIKLPAELRAVVAGMEMQIASEGYSTSEIARFAKKAGYDGVIFKGIEDIGVNYKNVAPADTLVVFDPSQIKSATDNIGTFDRNNPDIRYELRDKRDTEYAKLAKDPEKNEKRLSQLVEQAAKAEGYDSPLLYHGTQSFGFTAFDLAKTDDGRSIFLTSNPDIASTYSGISGSRRISEAADIDVNGMSVREVAQMLNRFPPESGIDYAYSYVPGKAEIAEQVDSGIKELRKLTESLRERFANDSPEMYKLNHLRNVLDIGKTDTLSATLWTILNKTDIFNGHTDFVNNLEQNIRLLKKAPESGGFVVEKSLDGYSIEVFTESAARKELSANIRRGNYALYAKLGNSLTVEGDGENWNALDFRAPDSKYEIQEDDGRYKIINKSTRSAEWANGKMSWNSKEEAQRIIDGFSDKNDWAKRLSNTRQIAEYAKEQGYDSVLFRNIRDNGGQNASTDFDTTADVYVIFNPNNVKSADTVTRDGNGNVIPLSQRFNAGENDIRFELRTTDSGTKYALVTEDISKVEVPGKPDASLGAKARYILNERFRNTVLQVGENDRVYANKRGLNEYANPAKKLTDSAYAAKLSTSAELNELLKTATNVRAGVDDGRHPDAVRGWKYYDVLFAVKNSNAENGYSVFDGKLNVKRIAKGDLFYDITGIKEVTGGITGQNILSSISADSSGDSNSIFDIAENVNTEFELRSDENRFDPRKELSNLFMQIAQNEQEKKSLRSYQAAIHELNNTEIEISKLQQEMQGTDKLKSPQKYYELQNKLRQAEAKLNRYDGRLVQLEATKPMKDLIARREQRLKEQFARSSTTRAKYRNNIKKNIRSLDKKLRTNSGQKHVLLELQPVVAQLLNVFTENTSVFKKEQLAKLREIYAKFNPEADSKMQATDNDVKRWKSTAEYSSAYSEMIYDLIEEVRPLVQGKRLIDLDTDLLAAVNDIVGNIKQKSAVSKSLPRRRFSVVDQSEHFTAKPPLKKYVFVRTSFGGGEGN